MLGTHRCQKAKDSPEMVIQVSVSHHMCAGKQTQVLHTSEYSYHWAIPASSVWFLTSQALYRAANADIEEVSTCAFERIKNSLYWDSVHWG